MSRKYMVENKKNIISLIIIFILVFTSNIYAAFSNYIVKFDDGKNSSLNLTNLNNVDYISLNDLAKSVFRKAKVNPLKDELIYNNDKFTFSSLSFYMNYTSKNNSKIIQFRRPCISYANNLLIPFNSLLIALEVLQIYSPEIENNTIYLNRFKQATPPDNKNIQSEVVKTDKISSPDDETETNQSRDFYSSKVNDNQDSTSNKESHKNKRDMASNNNISHVLNDNSRIVKKTTPNNYIIPQNLKRKLGENFVYDETKINKNNIFANNQAKSVSKTINIIKIIAEKRGNQILIHLYSNEIIEQYQKPECEANKLTIRIPNVNNKITDYSSVLNLGEIKSVTADKIRDYQIYYLVINDEIKECSSKRNGPRELIFTIITKHLLRQNKESEPIKSDTEVKQSIRKEANVKTKQNIDRNTKNDFSKEKKKWDLDCIVLDPGHGGKDAGAVSISGIYEKDITLKIAKKVRELLINKMPNTRVVMTRDDDRFVELYKRGQIANKEHGKLFISIHLNSARKKPSKANGIETYILRPGKNKEAIRVANFENSAIKFENNSTHYKNLTDEELIISTMAQSSFVKFSELLARLIQTNVSQTTHLADRGVKQAGFYVLIGASMPNVLFESGFLSNKKDEKFISSDYGIEKTAIGIVNAIIKYAAEYKKY